VTRVDARSLACPLPIIRLAQALRLLAPGEELELVATDPAVEADVPAFCESTGNVLISLAREGNERVARVRKA
jgi:tRNA 2-thiouridine synthesizing protein A